MTETEEVHPQVKTALTQAELSEGGARSKAPAKNSAFTDRILNHVDWAITQQTGHPFLDHTLFNVMLGIVVFLNTLQLGLEVDYPEHVAAWQICENSFALLFLLEALVKIALLKRMYFQDKWNCLDFMLMMFAVLDAWILALAPLGTSGRSMSLLRVLRILRLARVLRLVKHLRQLALVLSGILEAVKTTVWVVGVLALTIYVGAVFCVSMLGRDLDPDLYPESTTDGDAIAAEVVAGYNPYVFFGTIPRAMVTLFNLAILGEWAEVVRPVAEQQWHLVPFFICYSLFVTFGILNVMIAMIVDRVLENARELDAENKELARARKTKTLSRIEHLIRDLDDDKSGRISTVELESALEDKDSEFYHLLTQVNLPRGLSAKEIIHLMDEDGDDHVDYEEFVQAFYRIIDCDQFQQLFLVQMGINSVKASANHNRTAALQNHERIFELLQSIDEKCISQCVPSPGLHGKPAAQADMQVTKSGRDLAAMLCTSKLAVYESASAFGCHACEADSALEFKPSLASEIGATGAADVESAVDGPNASLDFALRLEKMHREIEQAISKTLADAFASIVADGLPGCDGDVPDLAQLLNMAPRSGSGESSSTSGLRSQHLPFREDKLADEGDAEPWCCGSALSI